MATTSNLTDQDITKLILESDSNAHSLEDKDTIAHSDSDTTDTYVTQWNDNTNCQPTVPVVHKLT
jgi:hypothetical protein